MGSEMCIRDRRHVALRGLDAADAHVAQLFGQRDVAVGQDVDVALSLIHI